MVAYRGWISKDTVPSVAKKLIETHSDTLVYGLKLDSGLNYRIKFTGQKVTALNNVYGLKDFLTANKNTPNIVVAKDIQEKIKGQILHLYPNTELFTEDEMMIDLSSHALFFPHEKVVSGTDEKAMSKFLDSYNLSSKKKLPIIHRNDISARYLNLKRDDIVRILRPSETAGMVPFYRITV